MSAIGNHGQSGFTLLEMLVALAIMALITGIAFPALQTRVGTGGQAAVRSDIALALAKARADAIGRAVPVRLTLGQGGGIEASSGAPALIVPQGVALVWPDKGFTFYPDGSARGGAGEIRSRGAAIGFRVDNGTGRIAFAP